MSDDSIDVDRLEKLLQWWRWNRDEFAKDGCNGYVAGTTDCIDELEALIEAET